MEFITYLNVSLIGWFSRVNFPCLPRVYSSNKNSSHINFPYKAFHQKARETERQQLRILHFGSHFTTYPTTTSYFSLLIPLVYVRICVRTRIKEPLTCPIPLLNSQLRFRTCQFYWLFFSPFQDRAGKAFDVRHRRDRSLFIEQISLGN